MRRKCFPPSSSAIYSHSVIVVKGSWPAEGKEDCNRSSPLRKATNQRLESEIIYTNYKIT